MNRFDERVVLVTGAGSGIGRAIAHRIVGEGGSVFAVDIDEGALTELSGALGDRVTGRAVDLTVPEAPGTAVADCVARFGRLDVVANVAGIHLAGHATDLTREQYRRVLTINLEAPLFLSIAAIPHLLASGGNIVNVTSHAGVQGVPYQLAYSVSKGGLVQLTRSLAVEYLTTTLRVNAIAPAGTNTAMAANASFPDDVDVRLLARLGGHRGMTEPDEIAALFAYLASDEARSVTGAIYAIDNGLTAS